MKEFSRSDMNYQAIYDFLRDPLLHELYLPLFSREIEKLRKAFPQLNFSQGNIVNNTNGRQYGGTLYNCLITKR